MDRDRGAWQVPADGVAKNRTALSNESFSNYEVERGKEASQAAAVCKYTHTYIRALPLSLRLLHPPPSSNYLNYAAASSNGR